MFNFLKHHIFLFIFFILISCTHILSAQLRYQWEVVDSNMYGNINYADKNHIVLMTNDSINHTIIKTTNDGGNSWNTIFIDSNTNDWLYSIVYPSLKNIIMTGKVRNNTSKPGLMIKSNDSGKTWTRIEFDSNSSILSISMLDENYGVVIYTLGRDSIIKSLLITNDGWQTWKAIALPIETKNDLIQQIECVSKNDFIILLREYYYQGSPLNKGYIYTTEDGGTNWTKSTVIPKNIEKIKFIDKNTGWAIGAAGSMDSLIYHTKDGGLTWTHQKYIEPSAIFGKFNDFDFYDKNNGIVVGDNGLILYTTDGGENWFREFQPFNFTTHNIYYVIYPSLDAAYASIPNHEIIKRTINKILKAPTINNKAFMNTVPVYGVKLEWDKIDGANNYELITSKCSRDSFYFNYVDIADTVVSDTTLTLDTLEYNMYYRFKIRAYNDSISSEWNEDYLAGFLKTIHDENALNLPIILEPEPYSGILYPTSLTIKWTTLEKVDGYDLNLDYYQDPYTVINVAGETNYKDTTYHVELLPDSYYVFRLRSRRNDTTSEWSWSMFFTQPVTDVLELINNKENRIIKDIFPNPASGQCFIRLNEELNNIISLKIFNSLGEEVTDLTRISKIGNENNVINLNLSSLRNGMYFIVVQGKHSADSRPFVILR